MIDRGRFFAGVRPLFGGSMSQGQVDGLNFILGAWESGPDLDSRWLAYALGTAFHETARTMQPVKEVGGPAYFRRMYDPGSTDPRRAALARANGQRPGDGVIFYGRGYVQLTWRPNYLRAGQRIGVDLIANPDLACDPLIAARVMFAGMREGWFTGKKFADYFIPQREDWINARRIINGVDKAADIAGYARGFYIALGGASR